MAAPRLSRAAPRARIPPLRLSYRYALLAVRAFWHAAWDTSPGTLPRRLEALLDELALFVLPERRPRRYPRVRQSSPSFGKFLNL